MVIIVDGNGGLHQGRALLHDGVGELIEEAVKRWPKLLHAWSYTAYLGDLQRRHFLEDDIIGWHAGLLFKCLEPCSYPFQQGLSLSKLLAQFGLLQPEHP